MALSNFIPEVWSKKLLKIFDKNVVMANLVNRDFEGEITGAGDVVHVRTFGNVTVNDYTRDMTISFQSLTDPMVDLLIDQQKYFAFKVDDLDKAQANIDILEGYAARAAIAIRDVVDSRLIGHYTDVHGGNVIGTDLAPITLTKDNIYGYITQLGELLDESNVPQEGRNLVITPKFKTLLLQSDEFTRATSLGDNVIQNGYIGNVAGFSVHVRMCITAPKIPPRTEAFSLFGTPSGKLFAAVPPRLSKMTKHFPRGSGMVNGLLAAKSASADAPRPPATGASASLRLFQKCL
ncbi:MAG TPA: P22 phage major capsid protein family protein [Oculatellaceae cyanobacterium]